MHPSSAPRAVALLACCLASAWAVPASGQLQAITPSFDFGTAGATEGYSSVGWAFRPRSALTVEELGVATLGGHMAAQDGRFVIGPGATPGSVVTSAVGSVEVGIFERATNTLVTSAVINPAVATRQVAITNAQPFYQGSTIWYRSVPAARLLPSSEYVILFAREAGLPGATTGMQGFWHLTLADVALNERLELQEETVVANDFPFRTNDGVRYDPSRIFYFDQSNPAVASLDLGPTFTFSIGGGPTRVVPEPRTLLLSGTGLLALAGAGLRRRQRSARAPAVAASTAATSAPARR